MIEFRNLTRTRVSYAPFQRLYKTLFPREDFDLSVVFAGSTRMRYLDKTYRGKDKVANVLSFPLGDKSGEIFLHIHEKDLPHLFVHGCLHLLGYDHEREKDALKMEKRERAILKR